MDIWELARMLLEGVLSSLSGSSGPVLQAIAWVAMTCGSVRLVMKPIMMALHSIAAATATKADDEALDKVEKSKLYVTIVFILDWILSIKMPVNPEPVDPPKEDPKP